jgi:N-sulfoglucosamine sulfohydrolase
MEEPVMRRTLLVALAALLAACHGQLAARAAEPARRNVLLLIADDLGNDCGCYGNDRIKTPNIDALARNGVRFTHGFAAVSSCSPSRASLYTGLHTHSSGQYGLQHAEHHFQTFDDVKSLPALLNDAGWRTGIIGKIHVGPQSVYPFGVEVTKDIGGNRSVKVMADKAKQFFLDAGDKPFFLVMGYSDPHRSAHGFGNENPYPGVTETRYDPKDVLLPYFMSDREDARKDLADYYQSVSRMDEGVGMVLDALREVKKDEGTLVIFLSDNGVPFPGAKTTLYDAGLRLPLIVSSPGQRKRGLVNHAMVSWVDVAPTILDWAGVKAPAAQTAMMGRSFLPILEEEDPKGWDVVYGSHQCHEVTMYYPMRMIRTRTHQYILNLAHELEYPCAQDLYDSPTWQGVLKRGDKMIGSLSLDAYLHRPREELYDLDKDPNELNNVAADPKYADVLADLRSRLREWQMKTKDPWVIKYKHE